ERAGCPGTSTFRGSPPADGPKAPRAALRFQPPANGGPRALPASRTDLVTDDGRRAGQLRSVVDHPELGPIGLAYVRRGVDDGRLVRAGDHVATVVDLPFRKIANNRSRSTRQR